MSEVQEESKGRGRARNNRRPAQDGPGKDGDKAGDARPKTAGRGRGRGRGDRGAAEAEEGNARGGRRP